MGEVATVDQLLQEYVLCARDVKDPTLVHLVHQFLENKTGQVIVFTNKCRSVTGLEGVITDGSCFVGLAWR